MNDEKDERELSAAERELMRRTTLPSDSPSKSPKTSGFGGGLLSKFFGRKSTDGASDSVKPEEETPTTPSDRIDLSQGTLRGGDLFKTRRFTHTLNNQLRGSIRKSSLRKDVIQRLGEKRTYGLGRREVRRELKAMRDEGMISRAQERNIRNDLGAQRR